MSYATLNDPVSNEETAFISGSIVAKFCNMGFVTSSKWFSGYITIIDGNLRLYADEQSARSSPQNFILNIALSKNHRISEIKRKDYSKDPMKLIEFYCFYIEIDNGIFSSTRLLKLGCLNRQFADSIAETVKINTHGV